MRRLELAKSISILTPLLIFPSASRSDAPADFKGCPNESRMAAATGVPRTGRLDNRCAYSRVFLRQPLSEPNPTPADAATVDAKRTSAVRLSPADTAYEVMFIGAPRWLNRIQMYTDASAFDVETCDLNQVWQPFDSGSG
jgi:hypothetical protein